LTIYPNLIADERKILIGLTETANNIKEMKAALNESGYTVDSAVSYINKYYFNNEYTYLIDINKRFKSNWLITKIAFIIVHISFFIKAILHIKYDVFVFIWNKTFMPFNIDLFILYLLKKEVIIFNCGDDVRYRPLQFFIDNDIFEIQRSKDAYFNYDSTDKKFIRSFYTQKIQEISLSKIVSCRDQATFQKSNYYVFKFPTRKILNKPKKPKVKPLIIHAPSDRSIKGTRHVLTAIDILIKRKLKFQFKLIENRSNDYVLSNLRKADILIDQPGTNIGKLSAEGLAASCVVICGYNPEYEIIPGNSPIINFKNDPDDLANKIEILIQDRKLRKKIMERSFIFWEMNYSPKAFGDYFNNLLNGKAKTFKPANHHKKILLKYAKNTFQKLFIKYLY